MTEKSKSNTSDKKLLLHVQVIDATPDDVKRVADTLKLFKQNYNTNIEFLITDQQVNLNSVDYLINELKKLKYMETNKDE